MYVLMFGKMHFVTLEDGGKSALRLRSVKCPMMKAGDLTTVTNNLKGSFFWSPMEYLTCLL
jgi:hypothetical protein